MARKIVYIVLLLIVKSSGYCQSSEKIDSDGIIGEWSVCSQTCMDCNGIPESKIMFNVCWEVAFKKDKHLVVTLANGDSEQYLWEINDGMLNLTSLNKESRALKKVYRLRKRQTQNSVYLDLINGKAFYTLVK